MALSLMSWLGIGDVKLTVELCQESYQQGAAVTFRVRVYTKRAIRITVLAGRFTSRGHSVNVWPSDVTTIKYWASGTDRDFASKQETLHPRPKGDENDEEEMEVEEDLVVEPPTDQDEDEDYSAIPSLDRRYEVPIPQAIPDSWHFHGTSYRARVTNQLKVTMFYQHLDPEQQGASSPEGGRERRKVVVVDVPVKRNVAVEFFGTHHPAMQLIQKTIGVRPYRNNVRCVLMVPDHLAVQGVSLVVCASIFNWTSLPIRVFLGLYKAYDFKEYYHGTDMGSTCREKERVMKVELPTVETMCHWEHEIHGFTIPRACMSSASLMNCPFVDLRYFLRLKVKTFMAKMTCDVPIFLGTRPSVHRQRHLPVLPAYHLPYGAAAAAAAPTSRRFRSRTNTW
ncbi:hypothetical protein ACOMHN_018777 [Nucella lapillus]